MATRHKRKTNPCEGCRERKKKCSTGQPCERCKRLGITCQYIKQITPPTVDYLEMISNQELQQNVNELQQLMNDMEKDLQVVRTNTNNNDNSNKKLKSNNANSSTTYQPNWQFSIGPLGVTIHTDITSVQGLLFHVQALGALSKSIANPTVPTHHFHSNNSNMNGFLKRHLLCSTLRRGNFQAMTKTIKTIQESPDTVIERQTLVGQEGVIMKQLVQIYFTCQSYNNVLFHEQTFRRLFISNNMDIINSPVACALCAVVLTMHCKHALRVISYDQQMQWAIHFFTSARNLISVEFDTISLETVITYFLMALFKANILCIGEAKKYLDISLRIRHLLEDDIYNNCNNDIDPGEYEIFKRIHKGFLTLKGFMQFLNRERGVPARGKKYMIKKKQQQQQDNNNNKKCFNEIIQNIPTNYIATPQPDESTMTARVILKDSYSRILSQSLGPFLRLVRCGEDDKIPLSLIVRTEENLKRAYFEKIPIEYQLPPSIFESDELDDSSFWEMLKNDKRCDLASVSLATQYYQILLSIHEPFLPVVNKKTKSTLPPELSLIKDDNNTTTDGDSTDDDNNSTLSSQNKSQYSQSPSQETASEEEEDDEEDDDNQPPIISTHSLRAKNICFKSAVTVIRLLEYQCTMLPSCTISRPILLSIWDIFMKFSCLGMSEGDFDLTSKQVQVAREYVIRCIGVLKRGYLFNAAERQIWEYYQNIEDQLLKALYGADFPPTANYFEPANTPPQYSSCC